MVLAEIGAKVVVADKFIEQAVQTVELIKEKHPRAEILVLSCDVAVADEVEHMVEKTVQHFGGIDCAINNAGVGGIISKHADYPEDAYDIIMDVNLKGVFLCMRAELARMTDKKRRYSIVNVSSFAGITGFRLNSPYAASKHGVIGLTKSTALEYARSNIRINAVCPSFIVTPMTSGLVEGNGSHERLEKLRNSIPMGRLGTPEDVASAIIWLLSEGSAFVTGASISVDGGMSAL